MTGTAKTNVDRHAARVARLVASALVAIVVSAFALLVSASPAGSPGPGMGILYVDDDAPAGGDGSTWPLAFAYLQDALAAAALPGSGVTEIRVAQGTYKPDQGAGQTPGNVNATFSIPSGIELRGGFAGIGATNPDEQNWDKFEAVLSGDLLGNDPPVNFWPPPQPWTNYADNGLHVVTVLNASEATMIQGVVATGSKYVGGNVDNVGGGVYCVGGAPLITDCEFRFNMAYRAGGLGGDKFGGIVRNCHFHHNFGYYSGAIEMLEQTDAIIEGCSFAENSAIGAAGAVAFRSGAMVIRDCDFTENVAINAGIGGALVGSFPGMHVRDCTFQSNHADMGGAFSGSAVILECEFFDNTANWGGAIYGPNSGLLRCDHSTFAGNHGHFQAGAIMGKGSFIDCSFLNNTVYWAGGGAVLGSGDYVNCRFLGNESWEQGGGAMLINAPATLVNCLFSGNTTLEAGGAVRISSDSSAAFVNCTIAHNSSQTGIGGIAADGVAQIINTVLWDNTKGQLSGTPAVTYSCVQGGWLGLGNVANDPRFVDPLGDDDVVGTSDDDLRLSSASPCIDAGNNTALPADAFDLDSDGDTSEPLPIDLNGIARRINDPMTLNTGHPPDAGAVVDIGAFEFKIPADITGDGLVNLIDLLSVLGAWGRCPAPPAACPADIAPLPNGNGFVDVNDLLLVIGNWSS